MNLAVVRKSSNFVYRITICVFLYSFYNIEKVNEALLSAFRICDGNFSPSVLCDFTNTVVGFNYTVGMVCVMSLKGQMVRV